MCGIAGIWRWDGEPVDEDRLRVMANAISHRGPDGEGLWIEEGMGLAHRRLAIIDLSPRAAQPMLSADERYVLVFNGEIYNYQELRRACENCGSVFRSDSDTEVLLHLYARLGEKMVNELRGMFAFAIWDREERRLFVARDRLGKKPFFYRCTSAQFAFASEIKPLLIDQSIEVDWNAVRVFLGLQYVPAPYTGFENVFALSPGHAGLFTRESGWRTWQYDDVFDVKPFTGTFSEAQQRVRELLEESVRLRLLSDVPVGAFLSGGVDSSAVVTLMTRLAKEQVRTFTMGFPDLGFDEREQARALSQRLGTKHESFEAQPLHAVEILDQLVDLYEMPYADSSALPTWLLARETSKHVKVVLTGDGADELFAGYRRYRHFLRALRWSKTKLGDTAPFIKKLGEHFGDPRFIRFARLLSAARTSPQAAYASLFTGAYFSAQDEVSLLQKDFAAQTQIWSAEAWMQSVLSQDEPLKMALTFDRTSYLPDDLNVKMDRATMAHGLEARAPFLDQELARFVASLPVDWLFHKGQGKHLLKQALKDIVPNEVLTRRKRGFQVPLSAWFRKELRPVFVDRCLSSDGPISNVCHLEEMQRYLKENDRGTDHGNRLWMLLSLATWLGRYKS